ncbi:MAG: molybdopterin-dependent oxidoreductase [Bryobacteraceae bacterium]
MNRRRFLSAIGASATVARAAAQQKKILLPSDEPNEFNLRRMWLNPVPAIDQRTWSLKIGGLVDRPQSLTVAQLRKLPQEQQSVRLKCVQCWSARLTWGGFRFGELVEMAKPLRSAKAIRIDCADKWYEYMSLEEMVSEHVLLVLDLQGKPLPDDHGAPLRLIDASKYGYKSAKLITSITFVTEGKGSMACDIGPYYSPTGEILPGYDHPLDLGPNVRKKIKGGVITEY